MYIRQTVRFGGGGECAIEKEHCIGKIRKTPHIIDTKQKWYEFLIKLFLVLGGSDVSLLGEMLAYLEPKHSHLYSSPN